MHIGDVLQNLICWMNYWHNHEIFRVNTDCAYLQRLARRNQHSDVNHSLDERSPSRQNSVLERKRSDDAERHMMVAAKERQSSILKIVWCLSIIHITRDDRAGTGAISICGINKLDPNRCKHATRIQGKTLRFLVLQPPQQNNHSCVLVKVLIIMTTTAV